MGDKIEESDKEDTYDDYDSNDDDDYDDANEDQIIKDSLANPLELIDPDVDLDAVLAAKSIGDAISLLCPNLPGLPSKTRGKYKKRRLLTPAEKDKMMRDQNRDNARRTRKRKKLYDFFLSGALDELETLLYPDKLKSEEIDEKVANKKESESLTESDGVMRSNNIGIRQVKKGSLTKSSNPTFTTAILSNNINNIHKIIQGRIEILKKYLKMSVSSHPQKELWDNICEPEFIHILPIYICHIRELSPLGIFTKDTYELRNSAAIIDDGEKRIAFLNQVIHRRHVGQSVAWDGSGHTWRADVYIRNESVFIENLDRPMGISYELLIYDVPPNPCRDSSISSSISKGENRDNSSKYVSLDPLSSCDSVYGSPLDTATDGGELGLGCCIMRLRFTSQVIFSAQGRLRFLQEQFNLQDVIHQLQLCTSATVMHPSNAYNSCPAAASLEAAHGVVAPHATPLFVNAGSGLGIAGQSTSLPSTSIRSSRPHSCAIPTPESFTSGGQSASASHMFPPHLNPFRSYHMFMNNHYQYQQQHDPAPEKHSDCMSNVRHQPPVCAFPFLAPRTASHSCPPLGVYDAPGCSLKSNFPITNLDFAQLSAHRIITPASDSSSSILGATEADCSSTSGVVGVRQSSPSASIPSDKTAVDAISEANCTITDKSRRG